MSRRWWNPLIFDSQIRRRTTPEMWTVLAWSAILFVALVGVAAFRFAGGVSPQIPNAAALESQLRQTGWISFGVAAAIYAVKWAVGRFLG